MTYLKLTAAGLVIGAAVFFLFLQPSPAPETPTPFTPPQAQELIIEKPEIRAVDDNQAEQALKLLGLWEPDEDMRWDQRSGEAGQYVFTNLSLEGGEIRIAKMNIGGGRLAAPGIPYFDVIEAEGLSTSDAKKDTQTGLDALFLAMPDPEPIEDFLTENISGQSDARLYDFIWLFFDELSAATVLPEFKAEGFRFYEKSETREFQPYIPGNELDIIVGGQQFNMVDSFEETRIETVSLTAQDDAELYNFQVKNITHESGTIGALETDKVTISDVTLLGFEAIFKSLFLNPDSGAEAIIFNDSDPYDPIFQTLSVTGFSGKDGLTLYDAPHLSIGYSAKDNGQFFKNIQAPNIVLTSEPRNHGGEDDPFGYHDPFSPERFLETGTFSYASESFFDETTKTMELRNLSFKKENSFQVSMSHKISNWNGFESLFTGPHDYYVEDADPLAAPESIETPGSVQIHHGHIQFSDQGIRDEIFDLLFTEKGLDIETSKNVMKAPLLLMSESAKSDYQERLARDLATSLENFIDVGGQVQIDVAPLEPVTFEDLFSHFESFIYSSSYRRGNADSEEAERIQKMDEALRMFNLSITHNFGG